jgi:hypothetical protein
LNDFILRPNRPRKGWLVCAGCLLIFGVQENVILPANQGHATQRARSNGSRQEPGKPPSQLKSTLFVTT